MPIVLDSEQAPPPLPQVITSDDGRLTAWVDEPYSAVLLRYRTDDTQTDKVRVTRYSGGETIPVRSGDAALTPGGTGFCYDAEPGLGAACFYQATPISTDGAEGATSRLGLAAAGGLATPRDLPKVWLTNTASVDLTRPVLGKELPDLDYGVDSDSAAVLGAAAPIVVSAATAAPQFELTLISSSQAEREGLARLLRLPGHGGDGLPPPVVLLRFERTSFQRRDCYAAVTSISETVPAHALNNTRQFDLKLATVARPDPSGVSLRFPGASYAAIARGWPSYADLGARGSYADLLTPGGRE